MLTSVSAHSALLGCQGRPREELEEEDSPCQFEQAANHRDNCSFDHSGYHKIHLRTTSQCAGLSTPVNSTELSVHEKQAALQRTSDEFSHFTLLDSE